MKNPLQRLRKWLTPGLGIKRWLIVNAIGLLALALAIARLITATPREPSGVMEAITLGFLPPAISIALLALIGSALLYIGTIHLNRSILAPFNQYRRQSFIDLKVSQVRQGKGLRVVALGGGTGLPSVLRGFKRQTSNITAIVTVADDGGSSGKLRQEFGIVPPGDLRQNLAALARDEDSLAQLFQYRFESGGLQGHSFGNLFLTALAHLTGSMETALVEASRVLAIQGRVLPATMQNITLGAEVRDPDKGGLRRVVGESQIPDAGGQIERVFILPENARAYPDSIRAILGAELIVIGPGSLFTSILPTLLVDGIAQAIRASSALCIYICNIATQRGETEGFNAADHVLALERHIGRGIVDVVLCNNATPTQNAGERTHYVPLAPPDHEVRYRYDLYEADFTDPQRPWRHSPDKILRAIGAVLAQRSLYQEAMSADPTTH
ncbi:MAG: YvcK family protein [Anaerolineae bacterium]